MVFSYVSVAAPFLAVAFWMACLAAAVTDGRALPSAGPSQVAETPGAQAERATAVARRRAQDPWRAAGQEGRRRQDPPCCV